MHAIVIDLSGLTPQQLVNMEKAVAAEIRHRMMTDEGGFLNQLEQVPEIPKVSQDVNEA